MTPERERLVRAVEEAKAAVRSARYPMPVDSNGVVQDEGRAKRLKDACAALAAYDRQQGGEG